MMKICQVCSAHLADDPRVFHRTCVGLVEAGYEVHLFAVGKGTETYYDRGVTIHPLPKWRSRSERFVRRFRVARMAADLKPDLFHVHEPELLGPVLAHARLQPVVYDVHESYLDVLKDSSWLPKWSRPFARFVYDKWERHFVPYCAGVVVVTEAVAQRYYNLHKKVRVITNYPALSDIETLLPVPRNGMSCVYAGMIQPERGLSQIFEALGILKRRGLAVRLDLAGRPFPDAYLRSLWDKAESLGIREMVEYHGFLPSKQDLIALQQNASIGLVLNLPVANYLASIPNRLGECMALGLPIVFSNFPHFCEIASTSGAGIAVDPTKPEQIADAIERLVRNPDVARQMGEAGNRAVRERFNWNVERVKLLELYRDILVPSDHNGRSQQAQ